MRVFEIMIGILKVNFEVMIEFVKPMLLVLAANFVAYLIGSFIALNLDVTEWNLFNSSFGRLLIVIYEFALIYGAITIYHEAN